MATTTFRITSRDGEMCLTSASTGNQVDFRRCNQYDAAQLWERKDYGPLGTAVFQQGRGCLHADCLLDRNEQACASGMEVRLEPGCDVTKGIPASLWTDGNMKHAYKGIEYCVHASAKEGGKATVRQCPDTGVPQIRFEDGELTQSSLAAANVFMHALRSDATGKCIGADDCSNEADAALSLNPSADAKPAILWNAKRNQCFDVDLPSQKDPATGQWRVADGYPKVITGEDPAVRAVGRFKDGACRATFKFVDGGRLRATVHDEEFCLDGETLRLAACSTTDAKQGWKTRPTSIPWIDPPKTAGYQAPPPEPEPDSPSSYIYEGSAPAPGPSSGDGGTLEWLANEKWFWPIVGVIGCVLLLAIGATMFYFFTR